MGRRPGSERAGRALVWRASERAGPGPGAGGGERARGQAREWADRQRGGRLGERALGQAGEFPGPATGRPVGRALGAGRGARGPRERAGQRGQAAQHAIDRLGLRSPDHHHPIIDQAGSRLSSALQSICN